MDVFEDEVLIARDKTKLLPGGPSTGGGIDGEPTPAVPLPFPLPLPPPLPPIG